MVALGQKRPFSVIIGESSDEESTPVHRASRAPFGRGEVIDLTSESSDIEVIDLEYEPNVSEPPFTPASNPYESFQHHTLSLNSYPLRQSPARSPRSQTGEYHLIDQSGTLYSPPQSLQQSQPAPVYRRNSDGEFIIPSPSQHPHAGDQPRHRPSRERSTPHPHADDHPRHRPSRERSTPHPHAGDHPRHRPSRERSTPQRAQDAHPSERYQEPPMHTPHHEREHGAVLPPFPAWHWSGSFLPTQEEVTRWLSPSWTSMVSRMRNGSVFGGEEELDYDYLSSLSPVKRQKTGASSAELKAISNYKLKKGQLPDDVCSICLGDFEVGEMVRTLPCSHTFHSKVRTLLSSPSPSHWKLPQCSTQWLKLNKTCPIDRKDITTGCVSP